MNCTHCGLATRQGARFCKWCGKPQIVPAFSGSLAGSPQLVSPNRGSTATVWVLVLLITPVLFVIFHFIPAIILSALVVFWLLAFPRVGIARTKDVLIGTAVALVVALGVQAYQVHSEQEESAPIQSEVQARATQEPAQLIPPPKYRVYKSRAGNPSSYVVPVNTSDEQLASLIWLFRKGVKAGAFAEVGITKPTSKNWGEFNYKSGMLLVYRGEKCANEVYISTAQLENGNLGPCGYGEHDDAYYQWGIPNPAKNRNGFFDEGAIRKDGQETLIFQDKGKQ